jgi:hypothetical protein
MSVKTIRELEAFREEYRHHFAEKWGRSGGVSSPEVDALVDSHRPGPSNAAFRKDAQSAIPAWLEERELFVEFFGGWILRDLDTDGMLSFVPSTPKDLRRSIASRSTDSTFGFAGVIGQPDP